MTSSNAIFATADLLLTLAHYKDVLGFETTSTWGDPPTFGSASFGGVTILFNLQPELATRVQGHQHWIRVDDPDELYQIHRSKGAKIVDEIEDKPWGFREYVVEDMNGYHLRFAGPVSTEPARSRPFPEGVTLERRKPSIEEYEVVAGAAFGRRDPFPGLMDQTWNGVVALSPTGEAVGVLRIVNDAPGWFSVWDVAVAPEWQSQRIGTTMMREALTMVREVSPGANVFLFTYKHGFYERLGFKVESASLCRV